MSQNVNLLFLDFDGVTHPLVSPQMFLPECMDALATAIMPYELEIVVTSTWRETYHYEKLESLLSVLGKKLQGVTPVIDDPFLKYVRYHEVRQYLTESNQIETPWLAIDDIPGFYPEDAPVYWSDSKTGFTVKDISKLSKFIEVATQN